MIFNYFIIAVFIFSGFRVLSYIISKVRWPLKKKANASYILPLVELFAWITYILLLAKNIYDSRNYFALIALAIVFVLIAFPLYTLIKDFATGIFLKMQNKIIEGTYINIEDIKGTVKKAGHLRIDIEDNHGNINSIPYHNIRSRTISRPGSNQNLEKVTIEFVFQETRTTNEIINQLQKEVMNTPWVAVSQPAIIESTRFEDGNLIVEVGAFVLHKSYAENIKSMVISNFNHTTV